MFKFIAEFRKQEGVLRWSLAIYAGSLVEAKEAAELMSVAFYAVVESCALES